MKHNRFKWLLVTIAAAALTTFSCSKSENPSPEPGPQPTPETSVDICITGDFNDFGTKAEIENIFRMTWSATDTATVRDTVYVYGQNSSTTKYLGKLAAYPVEGTGNRVADLKGTITSPDDDTKLTLVYSPVLTEAPEVSGDAISIDLKNQSGAAGSVVFVAYTAVDYKGSETATYRTSFSFATSVLRVNVSGMGSNLPLTKASINSIETVCKLALNASVAPTVSGTTSDTIFRNFPESVSTNDKGRVAFYVAVPAFSAYAKRELRVSEKDSSTFLFPEFATGTKDAGKMINSIAAIPTPIKYFEGTTDLGYGTFIPETGVIWAPVNRGYDATDYKYGRLYQWGRKYGQGYDSGDGDYPGKSGGNQSLESLSSALTSHPDSSDYNGKFYYGLAYWYDGTSPAPDKLWNSNEGTAGAPVSKTAYDPCPDGWRVPTSAELDALSGDGHGAYLSTAGWDSNLKGYWFNGTKTPRVGEGLFLPAAGYRRYNQGGAIFSRNSRGLYWSSSRDNDNTAWILCFYSTNEGPALDSRNRSYGYSVRCVQE